VTVALVLAAYGVVIGLVAPRLLVRAGWVRASPRLGVLAWQASVLAVLASTVLLALAAFVPVDRVTFDLGHLLHVCAAKLTSVATVDAGVWARAVAFGVAGLTLSRLAWCLLRQAGSLRAARRRHRAFLALLAARQDDGAEIVESTVPLAYCVPGGAGRIVLTRGAVDRLTVEGRAAVLEHERAHLRGRHDLVLFGADVAAAAFRPIRFFQQAREELSVLVEMLADDAAARRVGARPLALALVDLGTAPAPAGSIGATETATLARVRRLRSGGRGPTTPRSTCIVVAAVVVATTPWVVALAPAVAARGGLCLTPL
jgi:Zn-dependent protease with chaperone function